MRVIGTNRVNGKKVIATLRERPVIQLKKRIRIPNTNSRKVA